MIKLYTLIRNDHLKETAFFLIKPFILGVLSSAKPIFPQKFPQLGMRKTVTLGNLN